MRIEVARGLVVVTFVACAACSSDDETGANGGAGGSGGAGTDAGGATGSGGGTGLGGTGGLLIDAGLQDQQAPTQAVLYVHSNTTLFTGDPSVTPLALQQVGDFDCIGGSGQATSMTDVAVNAAGELWAVSASRIYQIEIQGNVVHCAKDVPLNNPQDIRFYALTFAPKGVLDPQKEVLVAGNSAGELWSIDEGGNLTQRGSFGNVPADDGNGHQYSNAGNPWELSGDLVFFENQGNPIGFATVRDCPDPPLTQGCSFIDTLLEIDVPALATATSGSVTKSVRGQIVKRAGCPDSSQGYGSVYGIAGYQDKVLGFSRQSGDGFAIDIENTDGTACLIEAFPGLPWAGAGITTLAPVTPPPPK